ncbi:MAG: hypothetical protein LBO80_01775, partial [Treponema sp.]|nr:hypothetical protein [Treponema sp.]
TNKEFLTTNLTNHTNPHKQIEAIKQQVRVFRVVRGSSPLLPSTGTSQSRPKGLNLTRKYK